MSRRNRPEGQPLQSDRNKPWSKVVGKHPSNVQAKERIEKDLEIYLRYNDPEKVAAGARDPRTWRPTGLRAREELGRKWDDAILKKAEALADALEYTLRSEAGKASPAPLVEPAPPQPVRKPEELSIARGVALATAIDGSGMVSAPMVDGERKPGREAKEIIGRSRTLLRVFAHYARPTPESDGAKVAPNWNTFTPVDADYIVRTLAAEHRATGAHGFSVAMRVVDEYYRMSRWLKEQGLIEREACTPRVKWKVAAKKLWEKEAGAHPVKRRPRHSRLEMSAIFAALDDPRGLLALRLARGVRLSLIADRHRSHLLLERTPTRPFGGVVINESADNVYVRRLSEEQRIHLDEALSMGFLRRYERARAQGLLEDFPLFPEGQVVLVAEDGPGAAPALLPDPAARALRADGRNVLTIDPRLRLALELGAALRLGQVTRTRRSQVDMTAFLFYPDDEGGEAIEVQGFVATPGLGNKQSPGIALNSVSKEALELALKGYLSQLEDLYRTGNLKDYFIYPAGRLVNGIAAHGGVHTSMPVTRDAMLGWFHELEAIAGVEHAKGRGWYGLRRQLTDTAPRFTKNEKALNAMAGTSTAMRNEVYQDREDLESKVEAADAMRRIRTHGRVSGTTPAVNPLRLDKDLLGRLDTVPRAEIEALIRDVEARRRAVDGSADGRPNETGKDA